MSNAVQTASDLTTTTGDGLTSLPKSLFGFEVLAKLGEGAASTIYVVKDPKTGQKLALKHVVKKTAKDDRFIEQCQVEFEISRNFKHPVLRKYFELKVGKSMFLFVKDVGLVMEYVEGMPLALKRPADVREVIDIFLKVGLGLGALHYQRFVHCDLKPSNILVDEKSGDVRLIDFGQTCKIDTVKERIQGTPDFIAPEQVKLKPVTERTDVYNYGATLYWTLTGQHVPTLLTIKKGQKEILEKQLYPKPHELNPAVSEALSLLVMQCLQYQVVLRPKDMHEVGRMLEAVKGTVKGTVKGR